MHADVSVIGLGRVGLPLALSFADRGLTFGGDEEIDIVKSKLKRYKELAT